jgi:outer membrane receptor protein involved in Fe transport
MGRRGIRPFVLATLVAPLAADVPLEQHSKHYFARGFDLEEGSHFASSLDGIPLNLPSALQGPGFLDTDLLIKETFGPRHYRKGPYDGDQGAFAIAGSADLDSADLTGSLAKLEYGGADRDRYGRVLWVQALAPGRSCALEAEHSYRPWDQLWQSAKLNGFLRLGPERPERGWTCTVLASSDRGDGGSPPPDRPLPADQQEDFDDLRLGNGFHFQRLFLGLQRPVERGPGVRDHFQIHAGTSIIRNWANGTYALYHPELGDQKELLDRRWFLGGQGSRRWQFPVWTHRLGVQGRLDRVGAADLYATCQGRPWRTLMAARGELWHAAIHGQSRARWGQGWRGTLAARLDLQRNRIHGPQPWTGSQPWAGLVSPRLSLGWSPRPATDLRASLGQGFRPGNAFRDDRPMIRSRNAELGARTRLAGPWESGLTLWGLELEHESLWDPAEGAAVLQGRSRRQGLEWFNGFAAGPLQGELSLGWSKARFLDAPAGQDRVPGSIPRTAVLELRWGFGPYAAGLVFKSLGGYSLNADNRISSARRDALELKLGRQWRDFSATVKVINAFNLRDHDRAYFYASQLPGEPWAVADTHTKHGDPQAIRVELCRRF